ncbi:MAG: penicillin-binding protein 1C [Polyangiaceae bacterium]|nr:penicillin-binding protein 1C [Polyangiaceae bacterium]
MKGRRPYATRLRRVVRALVGLALAPVVALVVAAVLTPLPASLREGPGAGTSVRYLDRNGHLLREVRADDGTRAANVPLAGVGDRVERAMLAAEDARFYRHPGVDPLAVVRAAGSSLLRRRVVSGASTLTMQLARTVSPHRRNFMGKFFEAALALRIEASLDKRAILEAYLNRVSFGPQLRGVDAASRYWFDKPPQALSWAEAATLASLPRGPSLYAAPSRLGALRTRRDRVLRRMAQSGDLSPEDLERALAEPLASPARTGTFGAPHFVGAVAQGRLGGVGADPVQEVTTTVDAELQREAEEATARVVRELRNKRVTAGSAVVLDNQTGEILAYVGSPGWSDTKALGQNDGVLALRQPGSTLKPFVYAVAMDGASGGGMTPTTLLPDLELHLVVPGGVYAPNNYDGRFHGPVRLREALANSYNVPAVRVANDVGPERVLALLHALGMTSLRETPETYGPAIALGDGEVRLLELARAYAILARGGRDLEVLAVRGATLRSTRAAWTAPPPADPRQLIAPVVASMLTDVLADRRARTASFGERNVLELPFEVAAKTGTSKGYRDNWTVGYTREVTVAVWVGNFDGAPMEGVSGISGAGPLFRAIMTAAMRGRSPAPLVAHDEEAMTKVRVCALSGDRAGTSCGHVLEEWVPKGHDLHACTMHEPVRVDARNGLRAGPGCGPQVTATRVFEVFRAPYAEWASGVGRADAPRGFSPACPGDGVANDPTDGGLHVVYPHDGARFILDAERTAAVQTLQVRADDDAFEVFVDGALRGRAERGVFRLPLARGEHTLRLAAAGKRTSEPVRFTVD